MATYAIGDVHGQYDALMRLLETLQYDDEKDELWFVGDIINRGPDSLGALRFVVGLGDKAKIVIGNHDFTLMVQASGLDGGRVKNTTKEIMAAPNASALIEAMYQWPLMFEDNQRHLIMAHAGLYPYWSLEIAREQNRFYCQQMRQQEVERTLFLKQVYRNGGGSWAKAGNKTEQACFSVNAFARMRFLNDDGSLNFVGKMPPKEAPDNLMPWYLEFEKRHSIRVLFGHWAALGLVVKKEWVCLDGGAAWGGEVIAFDLDEWAVAGRQSV